MPREGHILVLDVGPSTTTIYGRREAAPAELDPAPADTYETNLHRLFEEFKRPTMQYDSLLRRSVPGNLAWIVHPVSGTFGTGLLQYVVGWWLMNIPESGVVLFCGDYQIGVQHKHNVVDTVSRFFRHMARLGALTYRPDPSLAIIDSGPRDYLRLAINSWLHCPRGIFHAATNAGKTFVLGALTGALPRTRFLIVVPHTRSALAVQGYNDFLDMGHRDVGLVKGSDLKDNRIVWAAMSTIVRRLEQSRAKTMRWLCSFHALAKDECHEHSDREDAIYAELPIWARLGMSATPLKTTDPEHDAATVGVFGPILHRISNSDLKQRGISKQAHVFVLVIDHERQSFRSYAGFHRYIVELESRNQMIVRIAQFLRQWNHRVIVSTSSVNPHAKGLTARLLEVGKAELYDSRLDADKRKEMLVRLALQKTDYVVASRVFDVGISEDSISAMIFAGPMGKSTMNISALQRAGRGLRLSKNSARHFVLIDLHDHTKYGAGQARRRMEVWRNDPAFDLHVAHTEDELRTRLTRCHEQWVREENGGSTVSGTAVPAGSALRSPFGVGYSDKA